MIIVTAGKVTAHWVETKKYSVFVNTFAANGRSRALESINSIGSIKVVSLEREPFYNRNLLVFNHNGGSIKIQSALVDMRINP